MTKGLDDLIAQHNLMSEVLISRGYSLPIATPDYKRGDKAWCVPWLATNVYGSAYADYRSGVAVEGTVVHRHYIASEEGREFWTYGVTHPYLSERDCKFYYCESTLATAPMPAPKARVGSRVNFNAPGGWVAAIVAEMQWSYPPYAPDQTYWSYTIALEKSYDVTYTGIKEDKFELIKE